jgi:hypothetical protein
MTNPSPQVPVVLRPPNPYDFGSVCQFLESMLAMPEVYQDYRQIMMMAEARGNEKLSDNETQKQKLNFSILEEEPFEMAMLRCFWALSASLIEFKGKPQKEQDLKREFLAKENLGNLRNALTTAGFPESMGKVILGQKLPEFQNFSLSKALHKGNAVFERAFHFVFKDNELTQKNSDELLEKVRRFEVPEDVRLYLNVLLYKVEVASTEKSFASMKRIISTALEEHYQVCCQKREVDKRNPKIEEEESNEAIAFQMLRQKIETIKEFQDTYFMNEDFIFVDKQVSHLKKGAHVEQTEKNNKPLISDEFAANIDQRPLIQLITALKKVYNLNELYLLKQYLLREVLKDNPEDSETAMSKFTAKKKLILDALKITRTDMIIEDVFNGVTDQKKQFIENFEKELLRSSASQLKGETLKAAEKQSGGLVDKAKRMLEKKATQVAEAQEEEKLKVAEEQNLGQKIKVLITEIFRYAQAKSTTKLFSEAVVGLTPLLKDVENTIARMEKGEAKTEQKNQFKQILLAFSKKLDGPLPLDSSNKRALQMWIKGTVGRIDYY